MISSKFKFIEIMIVFFFLIKHVNLNNFIIFVCEYLTGILNWMLMLKYWRIAYYQFLKQDSKIMKTNLLIMQSSIKWYVDQKSNKYSIIMNLLNYYKFYLWMLFNNPVSVYECNYRWNIEFQIFHLTVSICIERTLFGNKSDGY